MSAPGLDHYQEAERLLTVSSNAASRNDADGAKRALDKAHVHALLAQTAALALLVLDVRPDGTTAHEWKKVFCSQPANRGQRSQLNGSSVASRTDP